MKYFTIAELTKTKYKNIDNTPNAEQRACLVRLVNNVLDPLREAYGRPIIVTSGFRCPKLNKAVGGVTSSQHMLGQAADIRSKEDTPEENKKLFDLILKLKLPFDQVINEFGYNWVHVSYSPRHRRKVMDAVKVSGKTVYRLHK